MPPSINFFAKTNFRDNNQVFGIKTDDRRRHLFVVGKTGMGKSNLLETLAANDIFLGNGLAFIDPHGDSAQKLLTIIPSWRLDDVIYFDPSDTDFPISFNVLEFNNSDNRDKVISSVVATFKKLFGYSWGPRMESVLRYGLYTLTAQPNTTLVSLLKFLLNEKYRNQVIQKEQDPIIKEFWNNHFAKLNDRFKAEVLEPVQNKISQFITNSTIRCIVGQPSSAFDVRQAMDTKKIIIVNLSKGVVGEDCSTLLGSLLVTKFQVTAMERADTLEAKRADFTLYIDECHNFITKSFTSILSEARKYRLSVVLAAQYLRQLVEDGNTEIRDAIFGNVGSIISFRVGAEDAETLEKEFEPSVSAHDLINLPKYQVYLKLMIDGVAADAFSASILPPKKYNVTNNISKIIKMSRQRYATPRSRIEKRLNTWTTDQAAQNSKSMLNKPFLGNKKYKVQCSACPAETEVNFKPDGKRPVFCPTCLKSHQSKRDKDNWLKKKESLGNSL